MKTRNLSAKAILIAMTAAGFANQAANAQSLWAANAALDQQFNQRLAAMQQQNANSQQQLRQQHLQSSYPRLVQGYRQYLASGQRGMSFAQFANWDLMTAAGTNVQGACQ